jgi:gliding motility-associated protein GldM
MALPKEPRQKMINMMYLVLTALLALNVSSEVLNAFATVEVSITNSNSVINDKNAVTYQSFAEKLKDPQTQAKAGIWSPKAEQVKKLSADLYSYVETLKEDLKVKAGIFEKDGVKHFNIDNLDAATKLMDKEKKGAELYKKLGDYKRDVIAVLKPEGFPQDLATSPQFQAQMKREIEAFQKSIPINLNVPKSNTGTQRSNDAEGWTQNYFHMTPAIAAMTILSKFQNDVKNTEAQLVDFCHNQIGTVKVVFDQFQAIATSNTTYAMPNDDVEITAGVGAFSAAAKPTIYVNGQKMPLTAEGTAIYKTKASGTGDHSVPVKIEYVKPDGTVATVNKTIKYTVGIPSGASVFLEKMNVMYIGVDNPITISGGSVGSEKVKVSFPGGSISRVSGDRYVAKPANPGMSKVIVNADGKNFEFPMRLKFLPAATAFIGSKKSGSISSAEMKAIGAVIAKLEDSDFEAPYRVLSYKLSAVGGPIQIYSEATNTGNRWSGQAAALLGRAGPGSTIFFDEIMVVGPDGKQRQIAPMKFNLK